MTWRLVERRAACRHNDRGIPLHQPFLFIHGKARKTGGAFHDLLIPFHFFFFFCLYYDRFAL